jgi:uncharacterized protein YjlB
MNAQITPQQSSSFQAVEPAQAAELLKSFVKDTEIVPGRRRFFQYRDLGVEKASKGRMRANISSSIEGMLESTGWHYHVCDMQFVYVMRGQVKIEFEDGTVATFGPGDAMFIPGGTKHNEVYVSEDKISLEVCLPAQMGTVACDRPAHLPEQLTPVSNDA